MDEIPSEVKRDSVSLNQWEGVIRDHEAEFWKVGEALINIKAKELWREEFSGKAYNSWEDYLEKAWGYTSRAKQLMQAAKLHTTLIDAGMSEEDFIRVVPSEAQAKKLSRAKSLSKEQAERFVEAVSKRRDDSADDSGHDDDGFDAAVKALDEIKPPKVKPDPAGMSADERKKRLVAALDKAKASFNSKLDSIFDEYGEPATVDSWLKSFAEDILERLSR